MWSVIPGLSRFVGRGRSARAGTEPERDPLRIEPVSPRGIPDDALPPMPVIGSRRKPRVAAAGAALPAPNAPALPALPNAGESRTVLAALDIYTEFFGLTAQPFSLTPDPDFLFWSPAHKRAYAMLEYGVMTHAPITLITGEVGAGKTTLLQHMLRSLVPEVRVGLISNPIGTREELLRWVLMSLELPAVPEDTYVDLFSRFQTHVLDEYAQGRRVILIFDEAQNLDRAALEELRMFTNINTGRDVLLQLVLVGQPELRDIVARRDMRQFAQRVAALFHLPAMDLPTMRDYIQHRLAVAGRTRRLFTAEAIVLIHQKTGGVPRMVNRLCDLALVYAFTAGRKLVDPKIIQDVLDDGAFFPVEPEPAKSE
ncbi:ExeA family protein [Paragemmobacter ruber]|nr:AAA family ATPase [Rhodobacter ruber]